MLVGDLHRFFAWRMVSQLWVNTGVLSFPWAHDVPLAMANSTLDAPWYSDMVSNSNAASVQFIYYSAYEPGPFVDASHPFYVQ